MKIETMNFPDHPYTTRELTVCGILAGSGRRYRKMLNIGMNRPHNPANHWWLKICAANQIIPVVLEAFPQNCELLRANGVPNVVHGDARRINDVFNEPFDIVLWWHGPEHLEKHESISVIRQLQQLASGVLILGCPKGFEPQGVVEGNNYERHRSWWEAEDFLNLGLGVIPVYDQRPFPHLTAWQLMNP